MRFLKATLVTIIGFMPLFAAATEQVTVVKQSDVVVEDTSAYHRMNKKFSVTGQPLGFAVGSIPSYGANVGYFINRNMVGQLEFTEGKLNYLFFDIRATTVAANLKIFTGNSFYIKSGVAYRKVAVDNVLCLLCKDPASSFGYNEALAAELAIGNQWQWDTFTLGCDWIGLMVPVANLRSNSGDTSRFTQSEKDDVDRMWNVIGRTTSSQLVRLYLGVTF